MAQIINKLKKLTQTTWWKSTSATFRNEHFNEDTVDILIQTLKEHTCVKSLEINGGKISENLLNKCIDALPQFFLINFRLSRIPLKINTIKIISTRMQECSLVVLDLSNSNMDDSGIMCIADAFFDCALEKLVISNNKITSKGAEYLGRSLQKNSVYLKELNISGNKIEDGLIELAKGIESTRIEVLNLNYTKLKKRGFDELCRVLRTTTHLENISIGENNICYTSIVKFLNSLFFLPNLTNISLHSNQTNDIAVCLLAKLIRQSLTIVSIDLTFGKFTDVGTEALCSAIKYHNSIKFIKIYNGHNGPFLNKITHLQQIIKQLQSERTSVTTILMSVYVCPRLATRSRLKFFSKDLIRNIADMIGPAQVQA
jgi:hypothetical protein